MPKKKNYISKLLKKQKKQENGKPSTEMNSKSSVSFQPPQLPASPSSYTLHHSIRTLLYDDFIEVLTTEELKTLIITGEPPIDELVTAWENITEEYSANIKTPKSTTIFDCYKKIERTKYKIKVIDWALFYLTEMYDEEIANVLAGMGYPLITPSDDKEEYLKQIECVKMRAKTLIVLLNQYQNEYKILSPNSDKVTRNRQDYLDELAILSKHQGGGMINPKAITVELYISIVNGFMSYQDSLRKQQEAQQKK